MDWDAIMMTPKLTTDEYSDIVEDWNRRVKRGVIEPCIDHRWARLPDDTDADPRMVCIYCLRVYQPDDRRMARPLTGRGAMPMRGRGEPI